MILRQYNGFIDSIRKTVAVDGVRGLFIGLEAALLSGTPYIACQVTDMTQLHPD